MRHRFFLYGGAGKSGRVLGATFGLMTSVEGTPSTYNKDLQEDKEPLFDVADTIRACVQICNGVISTLEPVPGRMLAALDLPMLATDLSDHLVRKGVPFREAHHVAGAVVKLAEDRGCTLDELTGEDLRKCHPEFGDDAASSGPGGMWDYEAAVERRQVHIRPVLTSCTPTANVARHGQTDGGTSRVAVQKQISEIRAWLCG